MRWNKTNDRITAALADARRVAAEYHCATVEPWHLCLSLLRDEECTASQVLNFCGIDRHALIQVLISVPATGAHRHEGPTPRLSSATRKVVSRAEDTALRMRHADVGTGHLLLGLLHDPALAAIFRA